MATGRKDKLRAEAAKEQRNTRKWDGVEEFTVGKANSRRSVVIDKELERDLRPLRREEVWRL